MTKPYYIMAIQLFLITILLVILIALGVGAANAASVKVCYKDVSPDASDVTLYVGSTKTNSVFPGQTQTDGSICGTITPIPQAITRGISQSYTLRAINSLGEESLASNAISFRYPATPSAPTLVSIGATVP